MKDRLDESEWMTQPMIERGLLHVIEPEKFVDAAVTERLGTALVEMITGGVSTSSAGPTGHSPNYRCRDSAAVQTQH